MLEVTMWAKGTDVEEHKIASKNYALEMQMLVLGFSRRWGVSIFDIEWREAGDGNGFAGRITVIPEYN